MPNSCKLCPTQFSMGGKKLSRGNLPHYTPWISYNSFAQELKILKRNDIYKFELAKFMHKFHHLKLSEIYKKFCKSSSVHPYQIRFANMENYLIPGPQPAWDTRWGRRVFWEWPNFFKLCPILSNYVQHIFPVVAKNFVGERRPPGYGPVSYNEFQAMLENINFI